MVPRYLSIYMLDLFCGPRSLRYERGSTIFCTLARYNIIIRNSNQTKKEIMNIGFLIIGGVIFATYMALTMWNIVYSSKKQEEENYPNLKDKKDSDKEG